MNNVLGNRLFLFGLLLIAIITFSSTFALAGGGITAGPWRDINPTQYANAGDAFVPGPNVPFNGIYVRQTGFGAVGAGEAWAVGGCGPSSATAPFFPFSGSGCVSTGSTPPGGGTVAYYNGFSWAVKTVSIPLTWTHSFYTGVSFCTPTGAPGVGLCSPNSDGSDGWIVGGNSTGPIALYVPDPSTGPTLDNNGLLAGGYLTSVFEICHVDNDPNGKNCPSGISGDAIAVGTDGAHGVIWQYSGGAPTGLGSWVKVFTSAIATIYNSVYMYYDTSSNTLAGFAVGDNGVVAQYAGAWTDTTPAPATTTFHGVTVDQQNPVDAWAVGFDTAPPSGIIYHKFGSPMFSGPVSPYPVSNIILESVQLVSSSEGWIVGTNSTILHGTSLPASGFSTVNSGSTNVQYSGTGAGIDLNFVNFQSSGAGWAVGTHGVILQTSDSSCGSIVQASSPFACWGGQTSIEQTKSLRTVYELGSSDAWAGGLYDNVSNIPAIIHWDGQKWHRTIISFGIGTGTKPDVYGIFMVNSGEGYAVGSQTASTGATCLKTYCPQALTWNVIQGNANTWRAVSVQQCSNSLGCNMTSVYFATIGSIDGWAVGSNGGIWTYTKSNPGWNLEATGLPASFNTTLNGVFINNPGNNNPAGWAVGNNATLLQLNCLGGSCSWSQGSIPGLSNDVNLYGIFFFDQNHGWIVGSQNTIITTTNNGGLWTVGAAANPPAGAQIVWRSVHVDTYGTNGGSGDGWAVGYDNVTGNEATAWWNGAGWSYLPLPDLVAPGLGLYSVFTTNPTDGWAVGAQPETGNNTLTGIFHLDPAIPPTVGQQATASNTTTESTSSSSSGTSQVTTSSSSSASTEPVTATSSLTVTSVTTSVSTLTIMSTPTSSTSTYSTPMTLPAVPGFPWESIIAGLILGMIALSIIRRRRK